MNKPTGKIIVTSTSPRKAHLHRSLCCEYTSLRNLVHRQGLTPKSTCNVWPSSWMQRSVPSCLIVGFLVYSTSEPVNAEVLHATKNTDEECGSSSVSHSHGKQVYTDYSIIGEYIIFNCLSFVYRVEKFLTTC